MIKDIRMSLHMSQREFAKYTGIPVGTIRNWEQGLSFPPSYVCKLLCMKKEKDEMVDFRTIRFIDMLNRLAFLSQNGIKDFKNACIEDMERYLFYDRKHFTKPGHYRVVLDACFLEGHHDIVSYYDNFFDDNYGAEDPDFEVHCVVEDMTDVEASDKYIYVSFRDRDNLVMIENGRWYTT